MPALLLSLLLAVQPVASSPDLAPAELAAKPEVAQALTLYELWLRDQMAQQHQPGLSVGIVYDQALVWAKGFGRRDVAGALPARSDTVYRIASISKTFTATAVMQLRDAGKLQLDDPVVRHLPWFSYRNRFPDAPQVTIGHLLTHTSGLPREAAFPYWTDRKFPSRERMIEALASQESVFEPETRYKYSNLGLALLGEVVAAVSGEPYATYVHGKILAPLGLVSTWVEVSAVDADRLATGYLIRQPDGSQPIAPPTRAEGLTPAAGISSTVEDLARFVSFQLQTGGGRSDSVLRESTRRAMQRVHWLDPSWTSGRGLGFSVWRQGERTLVGHGGWVAGHRTQIAFDPASKIGVVVLTNCDEGGPGSYVRQAFDLVAPAIQKTVAGEPPAAPVVAAERYLDAYHSPSGERTDVLLLGTRLVLYDHSYPPTADVKGQITDLTPEGEHVFRMTGENGDGERVVFELRPDGRVARVKVGENYIFPEDCGRIGEDLNCLWE